MLNPTNADRPVTIAPRAVNTNSASSPTPRPATRGLRAPACSLTGKEQVVVPDFLFAADPRVDVSRPNSSEYAEDTGEAPIHPASDRVDAAVRSDEGVHSDVRPVRMGQLIRATPGFWHPR